MIVRAKAGGGKKYAWRNLGTERRRTETGLNVERLNHVVCTHVYVYVHTSLCDRRRTCALRFNVIEYVDSPSDEDTRKRFRSVAIKCDRKCPCESYDTRSRVDDDVFSETSVYDTLEKEKEHRDARCRNRR